MVGVFHATGLGGVEADQGKVSYTILRQCPKLMVRQALLYYTFSALQGYRPAEMALGYRHWAGISGQEVGLFRLLSSTRLLLTRWTVMFSRAGLLRSRCQSR